MKIGRLADRFRWMHANVVLEAATARGSSRGTLDATDGRMKPRQKV